MPETLKAKDQQVRDMQFSEREPLTILYTQVEELKQLRNAVTLPYSMKQLIDIALIVITQTGEYMDGISTAINNQS